MSTGGEALEGRADAGPAPVITRVHYDGSILSVSWAATPNPATTFSIDVFHSGNVPVASVDAGPATNGWLPLRLEKGGSYRVTVTMWLGAAAHWTSSSVSVVVDEPVILFASTNPVTGVVTLRTGDQDTNTYLLRELFDGLPNGPDRQVQGGWIVVDGPQPPGSRAAASIAKLVTGQGTDRIGPFGPAFPIPTDRTDLLAADYDGKSLLVRWTAIPGACRYDVAILENAAPLPATHVYAPNAEVSIPFEPKAGASYAVSVQGVFPADLTGTVSSGPASLPLAVVLAAPTITSVAVTAGRATLVIDGAAPSGVTPTAYDVTIGRDLVPAFTTTVPASPFPISVPFDLPPSPGSAYTVSIGARVGRSSGPAMWSTAVLAVPAITSVTCDTSHLVVKTGRGSTAEGTAVDAVLYVNGVAGKATPVGTDGTVTFDKPTGVTDAAAIAVRGRAGVATGPWTVPIAAILRTPYVLQARSDADGVDLVWSGDPAGTYHVAALGAYATVQGTTVRLPCLPGSAHEATVVQVAGVVTGPEVRVALAPDGPNLLSATVGTGRAATIQWLPSTSDVTTLQVVLRWPGTERVLGWQSANHPLVLTLPTDVPNGATVGLRGITGSTAISPVGNAATLLTVPPTGLSVEYTDGDVVATWDLVGDAAVDSYVVHVQATSGAKPVELPVAAPPVRIPFPSTAKSPTVTVAAAIGAIGSSATGPATSWGVASAPVGVLVVAPVITSAVHDGTNLHLTWRDTLDASEFRVSIESAGVAAHVLHVGGTGAVLALPPGEWAASVRAVGASTVGPPGTVKLLTSAPVLSPVTFDPATGDATLRWAEVTGATGYAVTVYDGSTPLGKPLAVTGTSCSLPASTFAAGGRYSATVRATASVATQVVEGPPATVALLPAPPTPMRATYDGVTVRASWDPVAGASGYRVVTVGPAAKEIGVTAATSGAWPLPAADPATTLVVQALDGNDQGAPSAAVELFPEALFVGPSYLAPQTGPALAAAPITLLLPELFQKGTERKAITDPTLDCTLEPGDSTSAPYPWKLTFAAASPIWQFPEGRDLSTAWTAFITGLQPAATSYGIAILTEAVSRAIPQTFAESLFFAYGLQFARGCVDLRPGIVLRVEYEGYQVAPAAQTPTASGYVTTAVAEYEVASYDNAGVWMNGLDAFLATLVSHRGVTLADPPVTSTNMPGGGGALDAFTVNMQAPFVRLVYPTAFPLTTSTGSSAFRDNAVLMAASTVQALEDATNKVRSNQAPGAGVAKAYFRGRSVVTALVRIVVDGTPRLVPLGTTVGNVLAGAGRRPPKVDEPLTGVTLRRPRAAAVTAPNVAADDWVVRLDWSPGDSGRLDLPVLHGDRLDLDAR